ncbi:MAG: VanZ family protein [Desulfobacterales bacterium]|nr:VanZ family protein [Desulfobacterales bacterium]
MIPSALKRFTLGVETYYATHHSGPARADGERRDGHQRATANRRPGRKITKRQVNPIGAKGYLSRHGLVGISVVLVLGILFFGLRFKGTTTTNPVSWHADRAGLTFGHYAMAYCRDAFGIAPDASSVPPAGLSFELALRAEAIKHDRFQILLMLHGGSDEEQLLIGQWRSALVVMHGNDYSGRRGLKRLTADQALPAGVERLITVVSGTDGSRIYIDGRPVARTAQLTLTIPNRRAPATLVVGNSVYARHSWNGDLFGLAVYTRAIAPATIAKHYAHWKRTRDFSMAVSAEPDLLYLLDDVPGHKALNRMGDARSLVIPSKVRILRKEILQLPWEGMRWDGAFWKDVALNLLGFIPLGFFLSALRSDFGGAAARRNLLLCAGLCFTLSLGIELAQAFIPSRSSQLLDLLLNTLGGTIGVTLQRAHHRRRERRKRPLSI